MASKAQTSTMRLFPTILRSYRQFSQQSFFSPAYKCDEAWNQRLQHPPVLGIKPVEFYYDIDKKYRGISKVFALDADLFLNKLTKAEVSNFVEEIEEVTRRLRESPDTFRTLPSTTYAALKLLLDLDNKEMILKMITAPNKYGIFPENHIWNLLFDHFLTKKEYTACARIAASLMLQEDFISPLTHSLAMLSCLQWAAAENNEEWIDYHPPPPEPEEEVKVRVKYISRPYDDDHFDLKAANHVVGKTLLNGSFLFEEPNLNINCKLLGLALYQKWDKLSVALDKELSRSTTISQFVVDKVQAVIENVDTPERENILNSTKKLVNSSRVKDMDLIALVEELAKKHVKEHEPIDIANQIKEYKKWNTLREDEIQRTLKEFEKIKLMEEIETKKKDLEEREEKIFFFEQENKLKLIVAEKKKFMEDEENAPRDPAFQWKQKKVRKDLGEEYVPPEVIKRRT